MRRAVETFPGVPLSLGSEALPCPCAPLHAPLLLVLVQGHGVVQVEHEERRGRRLLAGREGPRTVRQAQDGEDLPLDLPAFVIAQPPVNKAGVHMVITHPALGAGQKAQAAPRQSEDGAAQRCQRCHHRPNKTKPVDGGEVKLHRALQEQWGRLCHLPVRTHSHCIDRYRAPHAIIGKFHPAAGGQGEIKSASARKENKSSSSAPDSTRGSSRVSSWARAHPSIYGDVTPSPHLNSLCCCTDE